MRGGGKKSWLEARFFAVMGVQQTMSPIAKFMLRIPVGLSFLAAMLFVSAGTLRFWQGWALMALFFGWVLAAVYLFKRDPQLLAGRLEIREKRQEQRRFMSLALPGIGLVFVIAGLDHRFGWSARLLWPVPLWLMVVSLALVGGSFAWISWAMKVNSFASRTIHVMPGQSVVTNGPYRLVRHPMYLGAAVMVFCFALALGSLVALPASVLLVPLWVLRLLDEEELLRQELPGYTEYCQRTPFRLIPLIW